MKLPIVAKLFKPKKNKPCLGLVLGGHAIKATIFIPPSELGSTPKVLGQSVQKQGLTSMRGHQILDLDAVLESTDLAISQAEFAAGQSANSTILGLFGEAVVTEGFTVRMKRPKSTTAITQKELDFLLAKVQEKTLAQEEAISYRTNNSKQKDQLLHLNTFLTQYKLDGKLVNTPLGLPGEVFEVVLVHTFARAKDLKVWRLLVKELGLKTKTFLSSSLIWAWPLLNKYSEGVLLDVGGQATEVVIFRNARVIGNRAFALGGESLTESISQDLQLAFDQAETIKIKYSAGLLDQKRSAAVREAITETLSFWVQGLESLLKEFPKLTPLPSTFLLTGGGATLPELKSALLTHPWDQRLPLSTFPKVEKLDKSVLLQGLNLVDSLVADQGF